MLHKWGHVLWIKLIDHWQRWVMIVLLLCHLEVVVAKERVHNLFASSANSAALQSHVFSVHYLSVKVVAGWIIKSKPAILSKRGVVKMDERHNAIWVHDSAAVIAEVGELIAAMDCPAQQVLIKAKIVNIDDNYMRDIGGLLADAAPASDDDADAASTDDNSGSMISIPLSIVGDHSLQYKIQALLQQGHAELVASPTLITQNRKQASIEAGEEVPYQEKNGTDATSVAFKKAVLKLAVTPIILPGRQINLKVNINQDQVSGLDYNGAPGIQTQKLQTQAVVADQHSLVLGGITQTQQGKMDQGFPFLRHLPVLGWLLTTHERKHSHKQLIVIITPKLL